MRLIADDAELIGDYVAGELGLPGFVPPYSAMGWCDDDGVIIGGVVFNNYTKSNVEASVAWTGPLVRSVLTHVRRYVFDQHKCRRMTIHTRKSRTDVIKQAIRLGFKEEGKHPAFYEDDDGVSFGLLRQNCRW